MRKSGIKRKREDGDGDTAGTLPESEHSRSRERDAESSSARTHNLADLDDEDQLVNEEDGSAIANQKHYIIIPSYASWFDYNAIHDIERRGIPDFFCGNNKCRTPEVYMTYRNFMIDTYRLNPFEYLSFTACRRNLCGDICSIARTHSFLEQWGLINHQVDGENRPAPIGPPATSHFMVLADAPNVIQPVNPFPHGFQLVDSVVKAENITDKPGTSAEEEKRTVEEVAPKPTSVLDTRMNTDQYASQLAATNSKESASDWNNEEILLLLEALEKYTDDWNRVSDHVGTRTQDECILKLLQLPIQDSFLEKEGEDVVGPLAYQPVPFSQGGNPVMSVVAYLASVVEPRILSAACEAAMEEYTKMKEEIPSLVLEAHVKNVEAHAKANNGDVDPEIGLKESGIASDDTTTEEPNNNDEPMETEEKKSEEGEAVTETRKMASEEVQTAAASALAAVAVKAKHLIHMEERRMKSLVAQLVDTQMKKLDLKLLHFDELERITDKEREAFAYEQQQLILERQFFHLDQIKYLQQRSKKDAYEALMEKGELEPGFEVRGCPLQMEPLVGSSRKTVSGRVALQPQAELVTKAEDVPSSEAPSVIQTSQPQAAPPQPTPPQPPATSAPAEPVNQPQPQVTSQSAVGALLSQPSPVQPYGYQPPYSGAAPPSGQTYPQGYQQAPPAGHYPPQQPPQQQPQQPYYPPRPCALQQQFNQRFGLGYDYNYPQPRPGYPPAIQQGQYQYPPGYQGGQHYPQQGGQPPRPPILQLAQLQQSVGQHPPMPIQQPQLPIQQPQLQVQQPQPPVQQPQPPVLQPQLSLLQPQPPLQQPQPPAQQSDERHEQTPSPQP
ncbi:unnamed protein product [Bursaphelenchus okinawaensis]|uniref:SWIRM domain-containing protein n=1 Tax=Bursaphelenchus okinawaensis TaxID=465554 RepID=A0A811L399_9BILA|nr:unnamed protein product [Bursaphelenchus okinawaensis]CAG9116651.1 unnamed protein product [Bursaphelenchus okinawaensis]